MENKKYILLDDQAIEIGGTNLTTMSILEDRQKEVFTLQTATLSLSSIRENKDKLWIIGNIMSLVNNQNPQVVEELFNTIKFIKLEFDYNFCPYRGEIPHRILGNQQCSCPHGITGHKTLSKIYDLITKNAQHLFFMSERQRAIYINHLPIISTDKTSILSSCFSKESFNLFKSLKNNTKNEKYAILEGYGGWHSKAKGVDEAKNFCFTNNITFDILPVQKYEDHIKLLSQYKGLVFLPIIDDTCPRCLIEARLLGLDVIANINSQHVTEWWWKDTSKTEEYLENRAKYFWDIVDSL
jgi:hypothetical protein